MQWFQLKIEKQLTHSVTYNRIKNLTFCLTADFFRSKDFYFSGWEEKESVGLDKSISTFFPPIKNK